MVIEDVEEAPPKCPERQIYEHRLQEYRQDRVIQKEAERRLKELTPVFDDSANPNSGK
jgi:transposase InsO family protein